MVSTPLLANKNQKKQMTFSTTHKMLRTKSPKLFCILTQILFTIVCYSAMQIWGRIQTNSEQTRYVKRLFRVLRLCEAKYNMPFSYPY